MTNKITKTNKTSVDELLQKRNFIFNDIFISCSNDQKITFRNLKTDEIIKTISLKVDPCKIYKFDEENLICLLQNGFYVIYNFKTFELKKEKKLSTFPLWSFIKLQNSTSFLIGDNIGTMYLESNDDEKITKFKISDNRISHFIHFDKMIVLISMDGILYFLNPKTFEVLRIYNHHSNAGLTCLLNVRNEYFLTCGTNSSELFIWNLKQKTIIRMLKNQKFIDMSFRFFLINQSNEKLIFVFFFS